MIQTEEQRAGGTSGITSSASAIDVAAQPYRFPERLIVLAKWKFFILKWVAIAAITACIVSLTLSKRYTATTRILPPQTSPGMLSSALLGQLGPLAALAGKDLLHPQGEVYVSMLRSRTLADALIERFSLQQLFQAKLREDARKRLEQMTTIEMSKDGIITVSVDARDPKLAADISNAYVEELDKLTKTIAVTEASRRRIFFEREMKGESDALADAEIALKQTEEKTGLILLDSQSKAMIESVASLRARIAAQEVEIRAMRSYAAPDNPDLQRAEQELAGLRAELNKLELGGNVHSIADVPLANVPTAGLEYLRKLRDLKYHEALYELLAKQYEAARIDEAKDATIIQALDRALLPERRTWPPRTLIVMATTLLASIVVVLIVFLREGMARAREDYQFSSQLQVFRFYMRQGPRG